MALERRLNDSPLHASPAPVHEPHFAPSGGGCRVDVILDDSWNIPRRERVEIELAFDRDANGLVICPSCLRVFVFSWLHLFY